MCVPLRSYRFESPPPGWFSPRACHVTGKNLLKPNKIFRVFPTYSLVVIGASPPKYSRGLFFFWGGGSCDHIHHPLSRPVACCSAECVFLSYSGSTDDFTFAGKGSLPSAAVLHSPFGEARSPFQHLTMNVNSNPRWQGMVPTASGCRVVCECLMSW